MSPTFRKEKGYTFKIYSNEEERMHIHVVKEDKEAKFWLEPKVEIAYKGDFSLREAVLQSLAYVRLMAGNGK